MRRVWSQSHALKSLKNSLAGPARQISSQFDSQKLFSEDTLRSQSSAFVIRSRTTDPFVNLSIEDYLLRHADPKRPILFTYVNRPCVVIGRNQNPWLEVDLASLRRGLPAAGEDGTTTNESILLIRRRSGGGTVFHDEGNLNYSFLVSNDHNFNRQKHAELVVAAIQGLSARDPVEGTDLLPPALKKGIRVNERHDIIMPARRGSTSTAIDADRMVKVSGSAYKLTRGRALHHGTLLFSSPNLANIGNYLRSPARGYIHAKGVESIRSPIGNLRYSPDLAVRQALRVELEDSIAAAFCASYKVDSPNLSIVTDESEELCDEATSPEMELRSSEWTYLQTPTFTFVCNFPSKAPGFQSWPLPEDLPPSTKVFLEVKHGSITQSHISVSSDPELAQMEAEQIGGILRGMRLHEIGDWGHLFHDLDRWTHSGGLIASWLSQMLPPNAHDSSEIT